MEVKTCVQCKKLFNYLTGAPLCPGCKDKLEVKFIEVKDYVREHPHENITQVAEANEVSSAQIRRWIREERLAFSDESEVGLDCEKCGKMIKTGRYCEECKEKVIGTLNGIYKADDSIVAKRHREAARMRFLDK